MIVDLDELDRHFEYVRSINSAELRDITWVRNGVPMSITEEQISDFRFIGLSNVNFPDLILEGDGTVLLGDTNDA